MQQRLSDDEFRKLSAQEREAYFERYEREELPQLRRQSEEALENLGRIVERMRARRMRRFKFLPPPSR